MADDERADVQVYEAADGWRWRLTAGNGAIIADGGEAYVSKANAKRAAERAKDLMVDGGD